MAGHQEHKYRIVSISVNPVGGSTQTVFTAGGVALSSATGAVTAIDTAQGAAGTTAAQPAAVFSGFLAGATHGESPKGGCSGALGAGYNTRAVTGTSKIAFGGSAAGAIPGPTVTGTALGPALVLGAVTISDVNSADSTRAGNRNHLDDRRLKRCICHQYRDRSNQ